jgi:peptide/nickel transport system permease protein
MSEVVNPKVPAYPGLARRVLRGARRAGLAGQIGMVLVGLAVLAATVGTFLTPFDPVEVAPRDALMPPFPLEGSDPAHPLGTDNLGRDMLSRLIEGSKISLTVGVLAVALSGTIGLTVGVISGYAGGWIDSVLMRIVDALISIPSILLIMVVMGVLDPGVTTLIVVLGLTSWVIFARQIRSEVLEIRQRQFVKAAVTFGTPAHKVIWRHIVPNVMPTFIVLATLTVATVIVTESSLSFLGLGVQPPTVSWGIMLTSGRDYLTSAWWLTTLPGLAITFTVLGILYLGDWLRDVLDPRLDRGGE